jgi:hypothetical protein
VQVSEGVWQSRVAYTSPIIGHVIGHGSGPAVAFGVSTDCQDEPKVQPDPFSGSD